MAEAFLGLSLEDRRALLAAAPGQGVARAQALLEKDVWVVWALQALFAAPFGGHLVLEQSAKIFGLRGGLPLRLHDLGGTIFDQLGERRLMPSS